MLSYLRKKMKVIMITVAVLFAATMFYGLGYQGMKGIKEPPRTGSIATVNGKEIDHSRMQQAMNRMLSQEKGRVSPQQTMMYQAIALEQTIDFTLMLNDAKNKFKVGRQELDQTIDQIMQANKIPNQDTLRNALRNMGVTMDMFKSNLKEEILVAKMSNKKKGEVVVSPEDLREVKASHILIMPKGIGEKGELEARTKAEELLAKIKKGESFSSLATRYSEDPGSASKGGELGYFTTGAMVPEFEKAAFALKPGEVSDVVKTSYGYHIIKLEDTRLRKLDLKGKDISEVVLAEKQDKAYQKWMYDLRKKAKIELNEPMIKAYSYQLAGKMDEAVNLYNETILINPSNPYIHLFLGDAYYKAAKDDLALLEYGKASEFGGADINLLISVGDAYYNIGKKSLALEQYRKASLVAGDNKEAHKELKSLFNKLGVSVDAAREQTEINRIEKKESFEKEIKDQIK